MKKMSIKLFGLPAAGALALGYLIIGVIWISWSDKALRYMVPDPDLQDVFQTYKGWVYVFATALLLYGALKRVFRRIRKAQEQKAESEERFRLLFEQAEDGIVLIALHAGIIDCNPASCRIFGVASKADVIGRSMLDLSPERQKDGRLSVDVAAELTAALETGEPQRFQWQHVQPSGSLVDVEVSISAMEMNGAIQLQAIVRDITERMRAEDAAAREQERLKFIFDSLPIGVSLNRTHPDGGETRLINDAHLRIAGIRREQDVPNTWTRISHPDAYGRQKALISQLEKGEIDHFTLDKGYIHPDGQVIWVMYSKLRRILADGGIEDLTTVVDITNRKQVEDATAREQERLKFIFDSLPIGICLNRMHPDGRETRLINDAHLRIAGIPREQDEPMAWFKISHPDDRGRQRALSMQVEEGKINQFTLDKRYVRSDGRMVWVMFSQQRRKMDDGGFEDLTAVVDITDRKQAEELLFKREREFRALVENSQYIIARYDRDCRRTYVNPAYLEMARMPRDELIDCAPEYRSPLAPAEAALLQGVLCRVLDSGVLGSIELPLTKGDNTERWYHIHVVPEHGPDGTVESALLTAHDITERKRAVEELQEAQRQMQYILNNTHDVIFQIDLGGNYIFSNVAAEGVTGYPVERLLNMNMMELIAPEHQPMVQERLRQRIAGELDETTYSFELIHKDGHRVWVELETKGVFNANGSLEAVQGVARDITHRRNMEEELRRLSAAINEAVETVVITDAEGTIQYVNPAFETTSGYAQAEAIGRNPRMLKSNFHDEDFFKEMWTAISAGLVWKGKVRNLRKEGTPYIEEMTISPVHNIHGAIVNFVAVKRDITKEVSLEEQFRQAQKMEAVGRLAGGVAHDLNNILQTILGFCGVLLMETEGRESIRRDVNEIQNATKRAGNLTRQLLTFSRKQPNIMVQVDLNAILENEKKMLERLLGEKVRLIFEPAEDLKSIKADAGQMEQVAMNLVVNARDAMPDGGQMILRTQNEVLDASAKMVMPQARRGEFVCLSLSDTGVGMDKDVLEHLFEPFFTTKPLGKGTGLGLAVLYGIVEQHHGWVHVASEVGKGSLFKVYLPVEGAAFGLPAGGESSKAEYQAGTVRVLLVEDDPSVSHLVEQILEDHGYVVIPTNNAEQALEWFDRPDEPVDLLLSDIILSDQAMTGFHLAGKLLELKPGLPVVLFSGHSDDRIQLDEIKKRGFAHLKKPFHPMKLIDMIEATLKKT